MALRGQLIWVVAVLWGSLALSAENDSPARKQHDQIIQEQEAAERQWREAYSEAKTDKERSALKYPSPQKSAPRMLALAKEHPRDPVAVDALVWIAQNCREGNDLDEALRLLLAGHANSEALSNVVSRLQYARRSDQTEPFLRGVAEKSPNATIQGRALLTLGRILKDYADLAGVLKTNSNPKDLERYSSWLGTNKVAKLQAADPAAIRKEAESIFETVAVKYADQPGASGTLGESAKGELYEMRHLGIGKVAPDIQGEDVDGKTFKLTEYRGKVVVLDFWGDW